MNRILFLNAVTRLRVPQGSDSDHMKIYSWQGLVASDEYRQKTAFALATSQHPNQVKTCDSLATSHSPQPNRKSKI